MPGFLEYIAAEREKVVRLTAARAGRLQRLAEVEEQLRRCTAFRDRNRLWAEAVGIREGLESGAWTTVEEFDRNSAPFTDAWAQQEHPGAAATEALVQRYLAEVDPQRSTQVVTTIDTDVCTVCGGATTTDAEESTLLCVDCGATDQFVDTTFSNVAFGQDIEFTSFSYKRVNHLKEFLNHLQAKELAPLPAKVVQDVMQYLFEKRLRDPDKLTFDQVKAAQKALGMRRYYDQTMQLWCRVTGKPPLRLEPVVEEKLHLLFVQIQAPFEKHCPPSRKNFLSYPYCIFKFCQLLKYHNLLPYLPLLKGKDKLKAQEVIFEKICAELGWEFIPV
jgi:hypothetical protein